tara:strand:+ start:1557 stop:1763 length:207 start_codon:yes stop_codon:yes gene_type:complete
MYKFIYSRGKIFREKMVWSQGNILRKKWCGAMAALPLAPLSYIQQSRTLLSIDPALSERVVLEIGIVF